MGCYSHYRRAYPLSIDKGISSWNKSVTLLHLNFSCFTEYQFFPALSNWFCCESMLPNGSLDPACATFFAKCSAILQLHNSPADWARELFKQSTDSGSLPVEIWKNIFSFRFGISCGWRHNDGKFLRIFGWGYLGANGRSHFWIKYFF